MKPEIPFASAGPHDVRIEKGEWLDHARGRVVPWKLYRPNPELTEKAPLIVWSHGMGGTRDGAGFLGRHLASHGYYHLHIQHDGTDDALWRDYKGHAWDAIRKAQPIAWEVVKNRYLDVPFVFDQITQQNWPIDEAKLGMSGHSFGALTTQVAAGSLAGRVGNVFRAKEPRFKAGILYSPVPVQLPLEGTEIYGGIDRPLLHITGTEDFSPLESFGPEGRLQVAEHAKLAPQHVAIINGADHMVFNGSRGQLNAYDDIALHQDLINALALAWWNAHLKDDVAAQEWLQKDAVSWFMQYGSYKRA